MVDDPDFVWYLEDGESNLDRGNYRRLGIALGYLHWKVVQPLAEERSAEKPQLSALATAIVRQFYGTWWRHDFRLLERVGRKSYARELGMSHAEITPHLVMVRHAIIDELVSQNSGSELLLWAEKILDDVLPSTAGEAQGSPQRCEWCNGMFRVGSRVGRPRKFCSAACKQCAYRRRAIEDISDNYYS